MEQELKFIETINLALAQDRLKDTKFRRINVARISLDRELNYQSKLDRRPELLDELREYGKMKWRRFMKERERDTARKRRSISTSDVKWGTCGHGYSNHRRRGLRAQQEL